MDNGLLFATPAPGFSALPLLEELSAGDESFLDFVRQLPLDSLREVKLFGGGDAPAAIAFLQRHGAKLQQLTATLEILIKGDVFNLCTNLKTLVVDASYYKASDEFKVLPENFFACSTKHGTLAKIHFGHDSLDRSYPSAQSRKDLVAARQAFEQLDPRSFPVLKEIQIDGIKWPTSEQQARKDQWVAISEVLHHKGIKVIDASGVGGPTGARAKVSTR